ncbi:MAG: biliverdin-producing heme oxygenase [Myxococcaceae bacterium]|jgi:heme oxygenase|nr:biliverdin-producing heme oxygenase [Myxococcaceae bacterium]MCA3015677.1 biliverdin-producing heme oxygenase [Myxococcaceae bacterium]
MKLRTGTAAAHREAESAAFVKAIFDATVERAQYVRFLEALKAVYGALEAALERHRGDPRLAPLALPAVYRSEALAADLAFYGSPARPALEATGRYVRQLEQLASAAPHRLVAHAYTRYLGDLSGGQALKKCIQRAFTLEGQSGVAFYEFGAISDLNAFKGQYRAALDALPLSEAEQGDVVAEAVLAFELNGALTREVSART